MREEKYTFHKTGNSESYRVNVNEYMEIVKHNAHLLLRIHVLKSENKILKKCLGRFKERIKKWQSCNPEITDQRYYDLIKDIEYLIGKDND